MSYTYRAAASFVFQASEVADEERAELRDDEGYMMLRIMASAGCIKH